MPSYQLKRTYQVGYMPPSKRSKMLVKPTLARSLALAKPEIKDLVLSESTAQVNNGTLTTKGILNEIVPGVGQGQRVGLRIRVLSIQISGRPWGDVNNPLFSLVVPNEAQDPPAITDFGTSVGGYYDTNKGWVMYHKMRDGANLQVEQDWIYKFPLGMIVHYDPPSETFPDGIVNKNQIFACLNNRTGANATNISYSIRIRYTDA